MLKRIIVTVLMLGLMQTGALLANEIAVTIDGAQINFQGQQPTIADGRALVPVRGVFEHLGFDVAWHQDTQEVYLLRAEDVIIITIGDDVFSLDGYEMPLEAPAQIIGGRTMMPIRAALESIGLDVGWEQETSTVSIRTPGFFAEADLLGRWRAVTFTRYVDSILQQHEEFDASNAVYIDFLEDGFALFMEVGVADILDTWRVEDGLLYFNDEVWDMEFSTDEFIMRLTRGEDTWTWHFERAGDIVRSDGSIPEADFLGIWRLVSASEYIDGLLEHFMEVEIYSPLYLGLERDGRAVASEVRLPNNRPNNERGLWRIEDGVMHIGWIDIPMRHTAVLSPDNQLVLRHVQENTEEVWVFEMGRPYGSTLSDHIRDALENRLSSPATDISEADLHGRWRLVLVADYTHWVMLQEEVGPDDGAYIVLFADGTAVFMEVGFDDEYETWRLEDGMLYFDTFGPTAVELSGDGLVLRLTDDSFGTAVIYYFERAD